MKNIFLLLCLLCIGDLVAPCSYGQCLPHEQEYFIDFHGDAFSAIDNSWTLHNTNYTIYELGTDNSATYCIDSNEKCMWFELTDWGGDGFVDTAAYVDVYVNGVLEVHISGNVGFNAHYTINCPPGYSCMSAQPVDVSAIDTLVAPVPDYWYSMVADSTGNYKATCCGLGNVCNTRIYVYDNGCPPWMDDGYYGTYSYGDNLCDSLQAEAYFAVAAGDTILIRIGDSASECAGQQIYWQLHYAGPIAGCMDSLSCNYNPLATVSDTCYYYPDSNCQGPDLIFKRTDIINSIKIWRENLIDPCYQTENCVTGLGWRDLMKFTGHIRNIGATDYYWGPVDTGSANPQYVYDVCHGHFHVKNIAKFSLYNQQWQPQKVGFKNSYAIINMACDPNAEVKGSGPGMFLAPGCGDIYGVGTPCQWIDVTDVDTGNYMLVATVNFDNKADKLKRHEMNYKNNATHLCVTIGYDALGFKTITAIDSNCVPFIDCAGDTLGQAVADCNGVCNGSAVRGDVNADLGLDTNDVNFYLQAIVNDSISPTSCNDLNGDGLITASDAAKANGCVRATDGSTAPFINAVLRNHLCELPYNVVNYNDTVTFGLANLDKVNKYFDVTVYNPDSRLMTFELTFTGVTISYIENLALGNYMPVLMSSPHGHIVSFTNEDMALFRQNAPLHLVRVHYSATSGNAVCLDSVNAVMNEYYNEVMFDTMNSCIPYVVAGTEHVIDDKGQMHIFPNPANDEVSVYLAGTTFNNPTISVINQTGQVVMEYEHIASTSNYTKLNISALLQGVYLLKINNNNLEYHSRLVVVR